MGASVAGPKAALSVRVNGAGGAVGCVGPVEGADIVAPAEASVDSDVGGRLLGSVMAIEAPATVSSPAIVSFLSLVTSS